MDAPACLPNPKQRVQQLSFTGLDSVARAGYDSSFKVRIFRLKARTASACLNLSTNDPLERSPMCALKHSEGRGSINMRGATVEVEAGLRSAGQ
eukprot:2944663-Pleurochrysis_carterae.AAC.1